MRRLMFLLALVFGVATVTAGCEEKKTTAPAATETKGTTTKTDW